jgi:hypothetical protein
MPITLLTFLERPLQEGPLLDQRRAGRIQQVEGVRVGEIDPSARLLRGRADAALGEAVGRRLDRVVGHPDLGGPGIDQQEPYERVDHVRMRGRAEVWRAIERHIGLDQHHVTGLDEVRQAANGIQRLEQHGARIAAASDADLNAGVGRFDAEIRELEGRLDGHTAQAAVIP